MLTGQAGGRKEKDQSKRQENYKSNVTLMPQSGQGMEETLKKRDFLKKR